MQAPNKQLLVGVPQIYEIKTVATNTANTCYSENKTHSLIVFGESFMS